MRCNGRLMKRLAAKAQRLLPNGLRIPDVALEYLLHGQRPRRRLELLLDLARPQHQLATDSILRANDSGVDCVHAGVLLCL